MTNPPASEAAIPFYDKKKSRITQCAAYGEKVIAVSAGMANLVQRGLQGSMTSEEFAAMKADGDAEFQERLAALAETGKPLLVDTFALLPSVAEAHFETLDGIDAEEVKLEAEIEERQATCEGPVPESQQGAEHIGPLILTCSGVVTSAD